MMSSKQMQQQSTGNAGGCPVVACAVCCCACTGLVACCCCTPSYSAPAPLLLSLAEILIIELLLPPDRGNCTRNHDRGCPAG